MHHPACWVSHDGCATETEHKRAPIAQAYTTVRPAKGDARQYPLGLEPRPAEPKEPLPFEPRPRPLSPDEPAGAAIGTVDGIPTIGLARPEAPPPAATAPASRPTPPRRYPATGDRTGASKPMPSIYGRHRILGYWYLPAAGLLAVVVAFVIVGVADHFTSDSPAPSVTVGTPIPSGDREASPAAGAQTPQAGATVAGSPGAARLKVGDTAVVTGTDDCLNVRTAAGRSNDAIACVSDGVEVTVIGGPETNGDLTWWKIRTKQGEGWAAEDYLVKK